MNGVILKETASCMNSSTLYLTGGSLSPPSPPSSKDSIYRGFDKTLHCRLRLKTSLLTLYRSNTLIFRNDKISSNLSVSSTSSFFCSNAMLNAKIASMPLARQLSYIRNTMSSGNLGSRQVGCNGCVFKCRLTCN